MSDGASAAQTGLSPSVEPVPVSPPDGASIPSARQMHMRWTTDSGLVLFEFPSDMSLQDADDVCALLEITMTGIRRRAQAIEARRAETAKTGSVHESAVR